MKTLNALKLRIMTRAFRIRLAAGENFENIAADYPALTVDGPGGDQVGAWHRGEVIWR